MTYFESDSGGQFDFIVVVVERVCSIAVVILRFFLVFRDPKMGDMHKGTPQNIMQESNNLNDPQRRRSARLSLPQENLTTDKNKMAPPAAFVKRRITVRKIVPRKTTLAPSEHNKENTLKRAVSEGIPERKLKVYTPFKYFTLRLLLYVNF